MATDSFILFIIPLNKCYVSVRLIAKLQFFPQFYTSYFFFTTACILSKAPLLQISPKTISSCECVLRLFISNPSDKTTLSRVLLFSSRRFSSSPSRRLRRPEKSPKQRDASAKASGRLLRASRISDDARALSTGVSSRVLFFTTCE